MSYLVIEQVEDEDMDGLAVIGEYDSKELAASQEVKNGIIVDIREIPVQRLRMYRDNLRHGGIIFCS